MSLAIENLSDAVDNQRAFETRAPFEKWLASLSVPVASVDREGAFPGELDRSESTVVLESLEGSNSELVFDGVLKVDGSFTGGIRSRNGKLVMTDRGKIEADVEVGVALIDGYVRGNITATERVVLGNHACVVGNVITPLISIGLSAILEGKYSMPHEDERERISERPAPPPQIRRQARFFGRALRFRL